MDFRYLNVDLVMESKEDLSAIVEDLGADVIVLHQGPVRGINHASFELAHGFYAGPDEAVAAFCGLIEALSPDARVTWDRCFTRIYDLGLECGTSPCRFWFELRPSTIKRVAEIGASIAISIYPMSSGADE
ncbi:MAG: hypothetical protein AB1714_10205 [Acidobacteriota bacterium]